MQLKYRFLVDFWFEKEEIMLSRYSTMTTHTHCANSKFKKSESSRAIEYIVFIVNPILHWLFHQGILQGKRGKNALNAPPI